MWGELLVLMDGARPAASNWQKCYTKLLVDNGLTKTRASTCVLYHHARDLDLIAHGDDFVTAGDHEDLQWLKGVFETTFEISTTALGHDKDESEFANVLNRIISVEES